MPTKRKPAKAKAAKNGKPKKQKRDFSQIALSVVEQATGGKPLKSPSNRH